MTISVEEDKRETMVLMIGYMRALLAKVYPYGDYKWIDERIEWIFYNGPEPKRGPPP